MSGFNADFNQSGNSVFENVYIYGILDYEFEDLVVQNLDVKKDLNVDQSLTVLEESWFGGIATFKDDVIIEGRLYLDYLTVNKEFEVGVGGSVFTAKATTPGSNVGIGTTIPLEKFQINTGDSSLVVTGCGTAGIGTTNPFGDWTVGNSEFSESGQGKLKLDISETVHIGRNIYDSVGSPGQNNYWLKRDAYGIRWQPTPPSDDDEGIKLQDEGIYVPIVGTAQTFSTINFVQRNSLGIGSDTLIPTAQNDVVATGLATVFTQDLWGFEGDGSDASIYRMTNVGINTDIPVTSLQVGVGGDDTFVVSSLGNGLYIFIHIRILF